MPDPALRTTQRWLASRRLVLTRSEDFFGTNDGATTMQSIFNCARRRAITNPHGPAKSRAAGSPLYAAS
jgi:hypothetical protein